MAYKSLDAITLNDIELLGLQTKLAQHLHDELTNIIRDHGPSSPQTWKRICNHILNPNLPFSFHQMMFYGCYKDFGPDPPAWIPDPQAALQTNIGRLLQRHGNDFLGSKYEDPVSSFSDFQEFSVSNPKVYWKSVLDEMDVSFSVPPQCIFREKLFEEGQLPHSGGRWLPGAFVNPARNCLTLNAKRTLDDVSVIWRDEGHDDVSVNRMTYEEMREEVWYAFTNRALITY